MRLSTLYQKMSTQERETLAAAAGIKPPYLYQLATRWDNRKPSLQTMTRLVQADKRLKLADLVAEFSKQPQDTDKAGA